MNDDLWNKFFDTNGDSIDLSKTDNIWEDKTIETAQKRRSDKKKRKEIMRHYQKLYTIEKKLQETK